MGTCPQPFYNRFFFYTEILFAIIELTILKTVFFANTTFTTMCWPTLLASVQFVTVQLNCLLLFAAVAFYVDISIMVATFMIAFSKYVFIKMGQLNEKLKKAVAYFNTKRYDENVSFNKNGESSVSIRSVGAPR